MKRAGAVLLMLAALSGCVGSERPAKVSEARGGYVVRPGDTMSSIAARNGLMLSALARANGIAAPYLIRVGQRLTIPKGGTAPARQMESRPVVQPLPLSTPTPAPTFASRPSVTTASPIGAPRLVWPTDGPVAETFGTGADPRGYRYFWFGLHGIEHTPGHATDLEAIADGFVSVTPLQLDLTHADSLLALGERFAR